jgi:peptide-methionine (R)-S-oxide reductase
MNRRTWLQGILAVGAGSLAHYAGAAAAPQSKEIEALQKNWRMLLAEGVRPPSSADKLRLSNDEWRKRLDKLQYNVLREEGTERPFTSPLNSEHRPGTFACAGCALPLFSSDTKYDSRTGWPSFYQPLANAIGTKRDFALLIPRTEVHCRRCGGHLGHVFSDGPPPTGLRYCINGVAMTFTPAPAA